MHRATTAHLLLHSFEFSLGAEAALSCSFVSYSWAQFCSVAKISRKSCLRRVLDTKYKVGRIMEQTWVPQMPTTKLELFSNKYYAACALSGMISTGSVHLLVTPFDMLKVNMQANPRKYKSIVKSFGIIYSEQGLKGIWKGWGSKLCGYSAQGAFKFGLYEYFKKFYSDVAGTDYIRLNKTSIYVASSLSAQIIADTALCPFESIKVRVQTGYAKGLTDGLPKVYRAEGLTGLYKGLVSLWGRNLPFAVLMFSTFEHSVDFLYGNIIHKPKNECSMGVQLGVTCMAGYMSGVAGTIISNPADNMITAINKRKGLSYVQAAKSIGLVGLFTRSLPLRVMLVGPLVTAQWFCYDSMKVLVGLPTSGGVEHLISDQDGL